MKNGTKMHDPYMRASRDYQIDLIYIINFIKYKWLTEYFNCGKKPVQLYESYFNSSCVCVVYGRIPSKSSGLCKFVRV